jgi:HEAT repeat protein
MRRLGVWASLVLVGLSLSGCESGPKVAYKELLDEDPVVRTDAVRRLGAARAVEAVESLIAMLDDPSEAVRVETIGALAQIGDANAVEPLISHLSGCTHSERLKLSRDLKHFEDARVVGALKNLLYDADETVRVSTAISLGERPEQEAFDALIEIALIDDSEQVRQHVVKVVGQRGALEVIPQVESALAAEADKVRANAARVLGQIGDSSSVPVLIEALNDPFYKVRSLSAHSLAEIGQGDEEAIDALRERLAVETAQICQVDIAWALALLGDRGHLETVRLLLARGDPEDVRAEAAMALGEVGDDSDLARLETAMKDKKGLVRKQAYLAIQKLKEA